MAFLTLNGVTIPTAKGGQREIIEIGDRLRAFDGTYIRDTRAFKRKWKFSTKPISELRAQAILNLIQGRGFYFQFENSSSATNGLAVTTMDTGVSYRFATAADGAAVVDENGVSESKFGTYSITNAPLTATAVNLFSAGIASGTSTTGTATTNVTASVDTAHCLNGTQSFKIISDGVNPNGAFKTCGAGGFAITGGHKYTLSAYVLGTGQVSFALTDNAATSTQSGNTTLSTTIWKRITWTITTAGGATLLNANIVNLPSVGTFWVDQLQLEDNGVTTASGGFPSSWLAPSTLRTGANLKYSAASPLGAAGMTVNMWITKPYTVATNQILFSSFTPSVLSEFLYIPASTPTTLSFSDAVNASGLTYTGWHMVTIVGRNNPETGEAVRSLYFDGVLKNTSSTALGVCADIQIGNFGGSGPVYSRMDDVQVLPFPVDANWITGTYNLGTAAGSTPFITASGDLFPESTVTVMGQVDRVSYMGYSDSGTWRPNGSVVEFTLEEV